MPSYVLQDVPWGYKHRGLKYHSDKKIWVYKGATLPASLRVFKSLDFSYERWREDELNGIVSPTSRGATTFTPREHQVEGAKAIYKAYNQGWGDMLVADQTGLGKTLTALSGITAVARKAGFTNSNRGTLLIVAPKGVMPVWRQTIQNYPASTEYLRPLIISWHQLNKLLTTPSNAKVAKRRRTKNRNTAKYGKPVINWDYVIFDEAHYAKNYGTSTMSLAAENVAQLDKKYVQGKSPFVLHVTATPGSSPLNFSLMSRMLSTLLLRGNQAVTDNKAHLLNVPPSQWAPFLFKLGFDVREGKVEWRWAPNPWGGNSDDPEEQEKYQIALAKVRERQREDAMRIGKALKSKNAPFLMRKPEELRNWPKQQTIALPAELSIAQRPIYEEAWNVFRSFLNLTPKGKDPIGALAETLRFRQKSSLLKVEQMLENVIDDVEAGKQVFISCEFIETIDRYKEALLKKRIPVAEISGRNVDERENERIRFQKGEAKVILSTVVAGISLHAGETLPDGTKATPTERITYIHDIRQNPLNTVQALGRCHRDGVNSIAYFPFFVGTVEEKIATSFTVKSSNMGLMTGSDQEGAEEMENHFRDAAAQAVSP